MTVALALEEVLDRKVFLKILPADLKTHPDILDQFEREAKALARLDHPNIISIHSFSRTGKNPYIVLEYFASEDLGSLAKDTLPEEKLVSVMQQCLAGLHHAHEAGVLHRDLKPQNILMNDSGLVKITDFGLSSLISEGKPGQKISGSPGYFASEAALGDAVNEASDIFSLGMVFYELACGTNPLAADDVVTALNRAVTVLPPAPEECSNLSPELSRIIQKMIEKSPADRYRDCARILEDLQEIGPVPTVTMDAEKSPPDIVTNRRRRSSVIGVGFAVVIGSLALFWLGKRPTPLLPEQPGIQAIDTTVTMKPEMPPESASKIIATVPVPASKTEEKDSAMTVLAAETAPVGNVPLVIIALPWASVRIDSELIGTTPLDNPIDVAIGEHTFRFEHSDYSPYSMSLAVNASSDTLIFRWSDIYGFVSFAVNPWAEVYIDGQFIDATPLGRPVPLHAGDHHIILKNPDYPLWQKYIELVAGDTVALKVRLAG